MSNSMSDDSEEEEEDSSEDLEENGVTSVTRTETGWRITLSRYSSHLPNYVIHVSDTELFSSRVPSSPSNGDVEMVASSGSPVLDPLCDDVLLHVLSFLDAEDLLRAGWASPRIFRISNSPSPEIDSFLWDRHLGPESITKSIFVRIWHRWKHVFDDSLPPGRTRSVHAFVDAFWTDSISWEKRFDGLAQDVEAFCANGNRPRLRYGRQYEILLRRILDLRQQQKILATAAATEESHGNEDSTNQEVVSHSVVIVPPDPPPSTIPRRLQWANLVSAPFRLFDLIRYSGRRDRSGYPRDILRRQQYYLKQPSSIAMIATTVLCFAVLPCIVLLLILAALGCTLGWTTVSTTTPWPSGQLLSLILASVAFLLCVVPILAGVALHECIVPAVSRHRIRLATELAEKIPLELLLTHAGWWEPIILPSSRYAYNRDRLFYEIIETIPDNRVYFARRFPFVVGLLTLGLAFPTLLLSSALYFFVGRYALILPWVAAVLVFCFLLVYYAIHCRHDPLRWGTREWGVKSTLWIMIGLIVLPFWLAMLAVISLAFFRESMSFVIEYVLGGVISLVAAAALLWTLILLPLCCVSYLLNACCSYNSDISDCSDRVLTCLICEWAERCPCVGPLDCGSGFELQCLLLEALPCAIFCLLAPAIPFMFGAPHAVVIGFGLVIPLMSLCVVFVVYVWNHRLDRRLGC